LTDATAVEESLRTDVRGLRRCEASGGGAHERDGNAAPWFAGADANATVASFSEARDTIVGLAGDINTRFAA